MFNLSRSLGALALIANMMGASASAQEVPRSAISWLSVSTQTSGAEPASATVPRSGITSEPLIGTRRDAVGLMPAQRAGLSADIWGISSALRVSTMINGIRHSGVPATRALLHRILLVEAIPPRGSGRKAIVLNARIDALMAMGAVDEAEALALRAGPPDARLFQRVFEIALLTDRSDAACKMLTSDPELSNDLSTRVFCAARSGQWDTAAMTLAIGEALGAIDPLRADHLRIFLDPEIFDEDADLPLPLPMSALDFVLREAAGLSRARAELPPAYLYRDIHGRAPVRDRMLAAERLSREGDFPYPILFAAYRARTPAASGGVWDRMAHVQTLDAALGISTEAEDILRPLELAKTALSDIGLAVPLALEYGASLARIDPRPEGALVMAETLLLANRPMAAAPWMPEGASYPHQIALALSQAETDLTTLPTAPATPDDAARIATAALEAFALPLEDRAVDPGEARMEDLLAVNRKGEVMLHAIQLLDTGAEVDPGDLRTALRALRAIGLEQDARQIAVQTILLAIR